MFFLTLRIFQFQVNRRRFLLHISRGEKIAQKTHENVGGCFFVVVIENEVLKSRQFSRKIMQKPEWYRNFGFFWRFRIRVFNIQLSLKIPYLNWYYTTTFIHGVFFLFTVPNRRNYSTVRRSMKVISTRGITTFTIMPSTPVSKTMTSIMSAGKIPSTMCLKTMTIQVCILLGFTVGLDFILCWFFLVLGDKTFSILR